MADKPYSEVRYNEIVQKGSHNSYDRSEGVYDQMIYWRLRSIEFDLHNAGPGEWNVYHNVDSGSNVHTFEAALELCLGFHQSATEHEIVTVFMDIKTAFNSSHTPDQLDATMQRVLGSRIFGAPDLMAYNPGATNLRDAVENGAWPTLQELRGKFIFVLTTGNAAVYVGPNGSEATTRPAFYGISTSSLSEVGAKDYVVFYNISGNLSQVGPAAMAKNLIARAWGADSQSTWNADLPYVNHLATNKVNSEVDTWSRTDNRFGFPFELIGGRFVPEPSETEAIRGVVVNSGDIWGKKDSFFFYYDDKSISPDQPYSYYVSGPGSHSQSWAKAGLMARASTSADAPYYAVFREAQDNQIRVQYRLSAGADTTKQNITLIPSGREFDIDPNDLIYITLEVYNGGKSVRASAQVNLNAPPTYFDAQTFQTPLVLQGLAASSHDGGSIRFLFGNPGSGGTPSSFTNSARIGSNVTQGETFVGIYPPV